MPDLAETMPREIGALQQALASSITASTVAFGTMLDITDKLMRAPPAGTSISTGCSQSFEAYCSRVHHVSDRSGQVLGIGVAQPLGGEPLGPTAVQCGTDGTVTGPRTQDPPAAGASSRNRDSAKPFFREPFKKRRCLLPVSSYCEDTSEEKQPRYFIARDGSQCLQSLSEGKSGTALRQYHERWPLPFGTEPGCLA
jgi:hypothetical protein